MYDAVWHVCLSHQLWQLLKRLGDADVLQQEVRSGALATEPRGPSPPSQVPNEHLCNSDNFTMTLQYATCIALWRQVCMVDVLWLGKVDCNLHELAFIAVWGWRQEEKHESSSILRIWRLCP